MPHAATILGVPFPGPPPTTPMTPPAKPPFDASTARTLIESEPDLQLAILFGSLAHGPGNPDSDLDIAVAADAPLTASRRQQLADRLAALVGRPVDLIDLHSAGGALLASILRRGTVLLRRDPAVLGRLYERLLDFQADLAPALDAMLAARRHRLLTPSHG